MRKYIILGLGLGMIVLLIVFTNFTDIKYLLKIDDQYGVMPEEILQKYNTTIQKIDDFIKDNNLGSTQSKDFDLDYYSQTIKVGIIPYIVQNDPLRKEFQEFVNDIDQYVIDQKNLEENNKTLYGNEMPVPTTP